MNAKEELLKELSKVGKTADDILDILVFYNVWYLDDDEITVNHVIEEYEARENGAKVIRTIDDLDFDYDKGYGSQYVFGFVLLKDNSWFERHEYDGAEWWEYKSVENIKKKFIKS